MRKISSIVDKTPRASFLHRQLWPPAHLTRIRPPRERGRLARSPCSRVIACHSHLHRRRSEIALGLHSGMQADALQLGLRGHRSITGIAGETPALPKGETPALREGT